MHNYLQFFNLQSDLNIYLRSYIKFKHVSFQNLNFWCETCNTTKICRRGVFFFFQLSSSFRSLLSMVQNVWKIIHQHFFLFCNFSIVLVPETRSNSTGSSPSKEHFWGVAVFCCKLWIRCNSQRRKRRLGRMWELNKSLKRFGRKRKIFFTDPTFRNLAAPYCQ